MKKIPVLTLFLATLASSPVSANDYRAPFPPGMPDFTKISNPSWEGLDILGIKLGTSYDDALRILSEKGYTDNSARGLFRESKRKFEIPIEIKKDGRSDRVIYTPEPPVDYVAKEFQAKVIEDQSGKILDEMDIYFTPPALGHRVYKIDRWLHFFDKADKERRFVPMDPIIDAMVKKYGPSQILCWIGTRAGGVESAKKPNECNGKTSGKGPSIQLEFDSGKGASAKTTTSIAIFQLDDSYGAKKLAEQWREEADSLLKFYADKDLAKAKADEIAKSGSFTPDL